MKAIFIAYNEALHEDILVVLQQSFVKGYTAWQSVAGVGSNDGEPHLGSHAWPTMNSAMIIFIDDNAIENLKEGLRKLDDSNKKLGLRFFSWSVDTEQVV